LDIESRRSAVSSRKNGVWPTAVETIRRYGGGDHTEDAVLKTGGSDLISNI
jgi:hypothetical protein